MNGEKVSLLDNSGGLASPYDSFRNLVSERISEMEQWLSSQLALTPPYLYGSIDIRCSNFKLAPVDTNLFPAGFNNFNQKSVERAAKLIPFQNSKILIITENFQRNNHYYENIARLALIFSIRNNQVVLGNHELTKEQRIDLDDQTLTVSPLKQKDSLLQTYCGFIPETIVLNNDMINGHPLVLQNLSQKILPPAECGWHRRSKHMHQLSYSKIVNEFCRNFDLDPWLMSTEFAMCDKIDFKTRTNIDALATEVDKLITQIKDKYIQYGINDQQPYVFIKSDYGTYGMGIMIARSGKDVTNANKKTRNQMHVTKGRRLINKAFIQEGVPTQKRYGSSYAEPVSYNIMGNPAALLFRYNQNKDSYGNLNTPGARFQDISDNYPLLDKNMIDIVSKLCAIAAARESLLHNE